MNLRQFDYALAVAAAGSVTAAAEMLHVAQPSVSQQIRGLERDLGVELFARTPTGLVPTVVGRAFLREAEVAVRAARRARTTARAGAEELVGELVVAAQMGLGARQLPGALGALRRRYPRLEVTVFEEPNPAELGRLARRGALDLALVTGSCDEGLYEGHRLGEEEFVVVLGDGHPQLAAERVELRELAREPWVRFDQDSALDGVLRNVLRDNGLVPTAVARATQTATAVRWAAHGLGATLVPASAVPHGHEHLARPVFPAVSQTAMAAIRPGAGPAETALLGFLRQETWQVPATVSPAVTERVDRGDQARDASVIRAGGASRPEPGRVGGSDLGRAGPTAGIAG
ncbi:LysR family transcriptional regulator [Saccharopolyspora sp. MS10]|uniref:LysR family transcriptional regulator n=1 Tax=Saccharopolyspora sp. MS10 TaxID=3385973 RepID=UPI0039A04A8A